MSVTVKNPVIRNKFAALKKPPIQQALNIIKDDNVNETTSRGWQRFKSGIVTKKDTDTSGRVFVNDNAVRGSSATNKQIGAWLQYGTPGHGPVKAKALRFKIGGKTIFAKWVKGIKAVNWWGLKESSVKKIRELINEWLQKSSGK
jgi:hypothetical protein